MKSYFSIHEIYVEVQSHQIVVQDLTTSRKTTAQIDIAQFENSAIEYALAQIINSGVSFSLLKRRIILHWTIDKSIDSEAIGRVLYKRCEAKDVLICTDKAGSFNEILNLAPWRQKKK